MAGMNDLKGILRDAVDRKRRAKDDAEYDKFSGDFARELGAKIPHGEISQAIIDNLTKAVEPVLSQLLERDRLSTSDLQSAIAGIQIQAPSIDTSVISAALTEAFANFKTEAPIVHVSAPEVRIPDVHVSPAEVNFPDVMKVLLHEINPQKPLPVQMVDLKGKPWYPGAGANASSGPVVIRDMLDIKGYTLIDSTTTPGSPALRVSGTFNVSASGSTAAVPTNRDGLPYNSDNPLPVTITSGASATTATNVVDSSGVAYSGSNPFPVTLSPSGSQNVNLFDGQASAITSHAQANNPDFRGIDVTHLGILNVVSVLNSTTSTLGSGGTFTGTAEDVMNFASISISVFADQASGTDGLSIQQSSDGTNWDVTDVYTIPASTGKTFSVQPVARYFRIVYTNSASVQGAFRLYPSFHYYAAQPSSQRAADAYTNETDLQQFWGFLSAYNGSTWDRLRNTAGEGNALRVQQANDAVSSVNIVSTITQQVQQVSGATDSVSIVSQIAALEVRQVSGGTDSVNVISFNSNTPAVGNNETNAGVLRVVQMTDSNSSVNVTTFNGNAPATGLNETVNGVLRVVQMTDSNSSVFVTGSFDSMMTWMARTTNPTAKADGADVRPMTDKLGRPVMRPIQVRELIRTAYVSVANGTEATLLAASAGTFLDLIMITATNNSSAATQLDIRATSAGNIIHTMYLPAQSGPIGWAPPVPWPQDSTGNSWTIDKLDETGTTVYVSALFSTEI